MPTPGVQYPTISRELYDGNEITCAIGGVAGHAVPGSRFVKISGNTVDGTPVVDLPGVSGDGLVFGVSGFDAVAIAGGDDAAGHTDVHHARHKIVEVKAGAGALAAGTRIMSDVDGTCIAWAGAGKISEGNVIYDVAANGQALVDRSVGAGQVHA